MARFSTSTAKLVMGALRTVQPVADDDRPLVLCGRSDPVELLRSELLAGPGSEAGAVQRVAVRALAEGDEEQLERAATIVYGGEVGASLDDSTRRDLEVVGRTDAAKLVLLEALDLPSDAVSEAGLVSGVSPLDILPYKAGHFPTEKALGELAKRSGDAAPALAARLPAFRPYVLEDIVEGSARRNAAVAAAVWIPGANLPAMLAVELRMVLRIAACFGEEISPERGLELFGVLGAGYGARRIARELLDFVPGLGWAAQAAIAYGATKGLGRAAIEYFERGAPAEVSRVRGLVEALRARVGQA